MEKAEKVKRVVKAIRSAMNLRREGITSDEAAARARHQHLKHEDETTAKLLRDMLGYYDRYLGAKANLFRALRRPS